MEAPKKIFVPRNASGVLLNSWYLESESDLENVEYIYKDAFIEKAAERLKTHSEADYFELIPTGNYCGAGNLNKKKMIEDFKKYMEEQS